MKIYIAGNDQNKCCEIGEYLDRCGHKIVSSWLWADFKRTRDTPVDERIKIAETDYNEVSDADLLVLVACKDLVPGGKFVEAGIAMGQEKPIHILGRRENMLLWHQSVVQHDDIDDLVRDIDNLSSDKPDS